MRGPVMLGGVSRVLLIEDDPAVRQGLELALTRQGHWVRAAESGEQGLSRLRADLPDVVVLDLMLPGMDGFEVCRRIRAAGEVPIYLPARTAILQRAQDSAVAAMTSRLETLYPLRNLAPGPAELGDIAETVTDRNSTAVAIFDQVHASCPAATCCGST